MFEKILKQSSAFKVVVSGSFIDKFSKNKQNLISDDKSKNQTVIEKPSSEPNNRKQDAPADIETYPEIRVTNNLKEKFLNYSNNVEFKSNSSGSFINDLKEAHARLEKLSVENSHKFELVFEEGLELFKSFTESNNPKILFEASEKFAEATELKKIRPEPYFFLSYIFSIAGDKSTSLRYYQAVKLLKPDYVGLGELKAEILSKS